jgi:LacI family gluconate utilization system Gnt-I transcriptional repressor
VGSRRRSTSEALRQRILEACHEMGYVIDQTARTFSSKRSGFVAALIPALNNSNFSDTAHGLTEALEGSGLQLLLGYTDFDLASEERLVRELLSRRPEAVVVTGGSHTAADTDAWPSLAAFPKATRAAPTAATGSNRRCVSSSSTRSAA